ncbi:hypothetical protein FJ251_02005 [bacterium]|nr:hypothetical protein [bacterium]
MRRIRLLPALARAWALFAEDPLRYVGLVFLSSLIGLTIVLAPMMAAACFFVLGRLARGETPLFADLFAPFASFERFLMGGLLWLGAQVLGLVVSTWNPLFGALVALVVNAFLLLYMPLMVEQELSAAAAFAACRRLFQREWLMLLTVTGLLTVLLWLGALAMLIGLVVAVPYGLAVIQAVYEQATAEPPPSPVEPPPPATEPPPADAEGAA